ncbi:MAG: OmpA family protein [Rhodanobacter sp.]
MQSITWHTISLSAMFAGLALAGCSTIHHKSPPMDGGGGAQAGFPDPARATMPEGAFVNIENLRKVGPGMTKAQLYELLGAPHFGEGVFGVRKWNYIFDFRKSNGEYFSCQYRIDFDRHGHAAQFDWRPESCRSVIEPPAAAAVAPVPLPTEPIRLLADALFAFDSADLTEQGREKLSQLLQQVQSASQVENVLIAGYTDRIGSDGYNRLLSQRRAESVRSYLADAGVPLAAMRAEGRGEADPVVQCRQSGRDALIACLAPNRRVELSGVARQ